MKHIVFSILWIVLSHNLLLASNGDTPVGARSSALGHASSTLIDVWSTHNNQGALGFLKKTEVGAFYENRFFVKELSKSGFGAAFPTKKGTFGINYTNLGYKLYRESKASLSYGLPLNDVFSVGIAIDYLNTKIADIYGQSNAVTGQIGVLIKALPYLSIATHIYNPFRTKLASYNNEVIPTTYKMGLNYVFSQKVMVLVEAEKTSLQKVNVKAGIEYTPSSLVYIRAGMNSYATSASLGFGIKYNDLKIDVSSMYHNTLGLSPQIGLSYTFNGKATNTNTTK